MYVKYCWNHLALKLWTQIRQTQKHDKLTSVTYSKQVSLEAALEHCQCRWMAVAPATGKPAFQLAVVFVEHQRPGVLRTAGWLESRDLMLGRETSMSVRSLVPVHEVSHRRANTLWTSSTVSRKRHKTEHSYSISFKWTKLTRQIFICWSCAVVQKPHNRDAQFVCDSLASCKTNLRVYILSQHYVQIAKTHCMYSQ